jgi:hypothetical protein
MLYRVVVTFIWLFWAVMVALLIRSEYFPEHASLYRLPPEFVAHKIFRSDTGSDLTIYYKDVIVGRARIEPAPLAQNVLKGSVQLNWPGLGKNYQSESYFTFIFNSKLEAQQFGVSSRGEQTTVFVEGNRAQNKLTATIQIAGSAVEKRLKWSDLEEQKFDVLTAELQGAGTPGLPPGLLAEAGKEIHWYGASTSLRRGERKIDAFMIASEGNRDYWVKLWLTPSGEVLLVQTSPAIGVRIENSSLMDADL